MIHLRVRKKGKKAGRPSKCEKQVESILGTISLTKEFTDEMRQRIYKLALHGLAITGPIKKQ